MNENIVKKTIFNNLPPFDFCYLDENNKEKIAKFVLLIGKNGSGKTSLLTLIAKLFDVHEKIYREYFENPWLEKYDVKNFNLNSLGVAKITMHLCDESIYFFFNDIVENSKFFDWKTYLDCHCLHEKNLWSYLPRYIWLTPNNYANDIKFTKYWKKLCSKEYKKTLNRKKHELEKKCYKAINQVNKNDTIDNLNIFGRYNDFFIKKRLKWVFMENGDYKSFCDFVFNNNKIKVYQLSSGLRHQIILLSIMAMHSKHIFLIDEPENSLYPFEQEEIINFLIQNSQDRLKKHQFFIATHSPFILKKFLNNDDTVIINIENGKNIKVSNDKKLLLIDDGNISYDEINYLYFDILTPSYYLLLFEKLKIKILDKDNNINNKKNDDMNCNEIDNWLHDNGKIKKTICIEINSKNSKNKKTHQTILVRFRHLLAHGMKNEREYKDYCMHKNSEYFKDECETINFYEKFNNNFERLLKENIELIRKTIFGL